MEQLLDGSNGVNDLSGQQRTLRQMADAYSRRAREARLRQGKPPVIAAGNVLHRIAEIMAADRPATRPEDRPAA